MSEVLDLRPVRTPPNMYPHINFPAYQFKQFPEWVTPPAGGDAILCHDEEEKAKVLGGEAVTAAEIDEKTTLHQMAATKGIKVDARWSLDTLRLKVVGPGLRPNPCP